MPALSPTEVMQCWFTEVWNARDPAKIADYLAEDAVIHALDEQGRDGIGPAGFLPFFTRFLANFGALEVTLHEVLEQGPLVAARWTAALTHTGDGLGPPATGRSVLISGISLARVVDGKIAEGWNEWDRQGLGRALA